MLDGDSFDQLEEIARVIKNSDKPFGGIQVCLEEYIYFDIFADTDSQKF